MGVMAPVALTLGDSPVYLTKCMPYKPDTSGDSRWQLTTALAIVLEAVDAFDPVGHPSSVVSAEWPEGQVVRSKGQYEPTSPATPSAQMRRLYDLMREVYFHKPKASLPGIGRPVPKLDKNFDLWLGCRKLQWRKYRVAKKAGVRPTPEEDFQGWLKKRKYEWSTMKVQQKSYRVPMIHNGFDMWLAHRKQVWRLQRARKRKSVGLPGPGARGV